MRIAAGAAGGEAGASNLRAKVHAMLRQRAKAWLLGSIGIVLAGAGYLQAASLAVPRPAMAGQAGEALYVEAPQQAPSPSVGPPAAQYRALLDRYCVTCHNERTRVADLALDTTDIDHVGQGAEVWEKVARKLRTRAMPPLGRPRPDETAYNAFASWLETALDRAAVASPDPGRRPAVHRLNRAEYTNAIRDLLGLNIDSGSLLPPDDSGYGFDNIADVLSVSPTLTERYLSAARKISRLAVGDPTLQPATDTFAVNKYLKQDGRLSEDLPFGSRGGLAVQYYFPVDGDYVVKIYLLRTYTDQIRGLLEPHQLDVRLNGARIGQFTIGSQLDVSANESAGDSDAQQRRRELEDVDGQEVHFSAKAGPGVLGVSFVDQGSVPEFMLRPQYSVTSYEYAGDRTIPPGIGKIEIRGPYDVKGRGDTPSRRRIFVCRPTGGSDEEPCADRILSTLARRAYRRPVTEADVQPLLNLYTAARRREDFDGGIEMALRRILVSPDFLFRTERDPVNAAPDAAYRISDLELASRLSFFLWSSIPDDELLDAAERGQLTKPAVLEQQVRRMLADPRSSAALVSNFAGQWLHLRNIRLVSPDPYAFPEWDDDLRGALERETQLFLESQLREDRSVPELLTADYSFVNERLARHYGIPNVYGSHFRRVTLTNEARKGLLGKGSILTVTSYPHRTSPVLRGKWLLENILGMPPPPPPPDAGALQENDNADSTPLSLRERMEAHRANPVCASCHSTMDPLGFALENFDGIGKWRTSSEAGTRIDASGTLLDGTTFDNPKTLRQALVRDPENFVTTVTEKLLTYALGRGVEYYDAPAIRQIVRGAATHDYRWSSLIVGITESMPFQMRRTMRPSPERSPAQALAASGARAGSRAVEQSVEEVAEP